MPAVREGILVGIGNPLLDITVQGEKQILLKYDLLPNNAIIAEEKHLPLYKEITEKYNPEFTAGGSTQNSLRVCQWVLKIRKACVFLGSVGKDSYSEILKKKAEDEGVNVKYQYQADVPTGTCAVIVTIDGEKHHRSLCANLAAAERFTEDHVDKPENMDLITKSDYIYIGGFFHTVSPSTIMKLAEIAATQNKVLLTNLSAEFICQFFTEKLMNLMPYVDVLFGNETEAVALANALKLETTDLKTIVKKISALPKKNPSKDRVVIITQGHLPVIIIKDGVISEIPVDEIPLDKIVDTNGAGDAFVGGFLSQFIQGKPLKECVKCGIWTATHIIQNSGCTFDPRLSYTS